MGKQPNGMKKKEAKVKIERLKHSGWMIIMVAELGRAVAGLTIVQQPDGSNGSSPCYTSLMPISTFISETLNSHEPSP